MHEITLNRATFEIALEKEGELSAKKQPLLLYFPNEENALEPLVYLRFHYSLQKLQNNIHKSRLIAESAQLAQG